MGPENLQLDLLTGFLSRKAFEEQLKEVIAQARAGEQPASLAFLDLDHFKEINDTYGHAAGDLVLREVASLVKEHAGEGAIYGRYGGDEFVILFPNTEREQAFLTLEGIRAAIASRQTYSNEEIKLDIHIGASAGIASFPIDGHSENELVRKADQALYRVKEMGRNKVRLAYEERMVPKTTHFTLTQLERLSKVAQQQGRAEAELLREALDDLLLKYGMSDILS